MIKQREENKKRKNFIIKSN